jgi:hypothetical protein
MKISTFRICIVIWAGVSLSACGELTSDDPSTYADAPTAQTAPEPYSEPWFDERDFVVAPWVHQFRLEELQGVSVEEDRIVFPRVGNDRLAKVEVNDILWAPVMDWEMAFAQRVDAIVVDDDDYFFYTRYVGLDEIFLKLDYELGDADLEKRILGYDPWADPDSREFLGYDPNDLNDPVARQMLDTGTLAFDTNKVSLGETSLKLCKVAKVDAIVPCDDETVKDKPSVFKALVGLKFKPEIRVAVENRLKVVIGSPSYVPDFWQNWVRNYRADECRCVARNYGDGSGPNYPAMYVGQFQNTSSGVVASGGGNRIGSDGYSTANASTFIGRDSCFRRVSSNSAACALGQVWSSHADQCVLGSYTQSWLKKWGDTSAGTMLTIDKWLAIGAERTEVSSAHLNRYMKRVSEVYRNLGTSLDKDDPHDWPVIDRILDDRREKLRKAYTKYFTEMRKDCSGTPSQFYLKSTNQANFTFADLELEFYKGYQYSKKPKNPKKPIEFEIPMLFFPVGPVATGQINLTMGVTFNFGNRVLLSWKDNPPEINIPRLGGVIDWNSRDGLRKTKQPSQSGFQFGCPNSIGECKPDIELGYKMELEGTVGPEIELKLFAVIGPTIKMGAKATVGFEAAGGTNGLKCEISFGLGIFATIGGEISIPFLGGIGLEHSFTLIDSCASKEKTNKTDLDQVLANVCLSYKHDFCEGAPTGEFVELVVYTNDDERCYTPPGAEVDSVDVIDPDGNRNKITEVQIDSGDFSSSAAQKVDLSQASSNRVLKCDHKQWGSKVVSASTVMRFRTEGPIKAGSTIKVIRQEIEASTASDTFVATGACGTGNFPCRPSGGFHVYLSNKSGTSYVKGANKLFTLQSVMQSQATVDTGHIPK